jgi:chromate reductase, NAD(P)H dehydrogenase (quinone)
MSPKPFLVLGIAGSLRRASFNRGLIRAAVAVAPEGVLVEPFELRDIPLYDADVDAQGASEPVRLLKERIGAADALLLATPEYNYSIPGVLKNAIDWASRSTRRPGAGEPPAPSPLGRKPVAILGASNGGFGTVRAQLALRQVLVSTDSPCLARPEVLVSGAGGKFDADGNLTDEPTRAAVRAQLVALVAWARRLRGEVPVA